MPEAARINDPIGHSPMMSGLLAGLLIGAAIGIAAVAVIGTGGLAAAAIIGGLAAGGAGIGEVVSTMSFIPKDITGKIKTGSPNVFTNSRPAARAHLDIVDCSKHPPSPYPLIATGSATVFINSMPAARVTDTITCAAVIVEGSPNVFIGGGTTQTDAIAPENLVPDWIHATLFVVGLGSAIILAGPVVAVFGLIGGALGGTAGNWVGGKIWGEGSDGQKASMLVGAFVGGFFGAKAGVKPANALGQLAVNKGASPEIGGFIKGGLPAAEKAGGLTQQVGEEAANKIEKKNADNIAQGKNPNKDKIDVAYAKAGEGDNVTGGHGNIMKASVREYQKDGGIESTRNGDGFKITDKEAYMNKLEKQYEDSGSKMHPKTKAEIEKYIDSKEEFNTKDGIPGAHAEVRAVNDYRNANGGADPDYVSTYKTAPDKHGGQGKPFCACANCSGIIPDGVFVPTGRQ
jgi:uncharacterized Zn-binding protein involved in type VI secretion